MGRRGTWIQIRKVISMIVVLACAASLILIPMLARRGRGYRGLYFALALMAFVAGFLTMSLPGGVGRDAPPAIELRGTEAVDAVAPSVGIWMVVTGVGCVLAAYLVRSRPENSGR